MFLSLLLRRQGAAGLTGCVCGNGLAAVVRLVPKLIPIDKSKPQDP